jgi:hypothetical protein
MVPPILATRRNKKVESKPFMNKTKKTTTTMRMDINEIVMLEGSTQFQQINRVYTFAKRQT